MPKSSARLLILILTLALGVLSTPVFAAQTQTKLDDTTDRNLQFDVVSPSTGSTATFKMKTDSSLLLPPVAPDPATYPNCSSKGALRWNLNTNSLEGCDGTKWISVGATEAGTLCGVTFWQSNDRTFDGSSPIWCGNLSHILCKNQPVVTNGCPNIVSNCPSGYLLTHIAYSWITVTPSIATAESGSTLDPYNARYHHVSCVKQ